VPPLLFLVHNFLQFGNNLIYNLRRLTSTNCRMSQVLTPTIADPKMLVLFFGFITVGLVIGKLIETLLKLIVYILGKILRRTVDEKLPSMA